VIANKPIDDLVHSPIAPRGDNEIVPFPGRRSSQFDGMARSLGREDIQFPIAMAEGVDHIALFAGPTLARARVDDDLGAHVVRFTPLIKHVILTAFVMLRQVEPPDKTQTGNAHSMAAGI